MLTCGLKLSHDSTVALAQDGKLLFSVELEKIENRKRHIQCNDIRDVEKILNQQGYSLKDVDQWVIDGWHNGRYVCGKEELSLNNYQNRLLHLPEDQVFSGKHNYIGEYSSYSHIYTHLCGSYCTSPFSKELESAYVLVFDGGTKPLLYYFDAKQRKFLFCKELLKCGGDIYAGVSCRFEPYTCMHKMVDGKFTFNLHFVGKVMAYIALGKVNHEVVAILKQLYKEMSGDNGVHNEWAESRRFEEKLVEQCKGKYEDADILASFHYFLQDALSQSLKEAVEEMDYGCKKICFSGGCMLNIKWNSAIRNLGCFDEIFAPPFINDTGSAIGAICAENIRTLQQYHLEWDTYGGPEIGSAALTEGWQQENCSVAELAQIIATSGEPVLMLTGRSELGPRALGNRSIIADARTLEMKDTLNRVKKREAYRPVAPICIVEDAPLYFVPGTPDKYMLFEHTTTDKAKEIPAVVHLDGTARLQTVAREDNETLYHLLVEYKNITGVSVLCNTSANHLGKGFFPDIASAQLWGECNYIWSNGIIYKKIG